MGIRRKVLPTVGDVTTPAVFQHGDSGRNIMGAWVFQSRAPLAVILRLMTGRRTFVEWVFARNLLRDALGNPGELHGISDVHMEVDTHDYGDGLILDIELRSPSGRCVLSGSETEAREFLDDTVDMVPICDNVDTTCEIVDCQEHDLIGWWVEQLREE